MEHSEADCREVLNRLYVYLDGEIAAADCASLERHIAACAFCMKYVSFERSFKLIVREKCQETTEVPEGVTERLRAQFRAE